jgi:hypothetical protein
MNPKLEALLQSRKFWASTVALATAFAMYQLGELSGEQLADIIALSTGIYIGSIALEEGLSKLFGILAQAPNTDRAHVPF